MTTRPAVGGGRVVDVPPERMARWLENFDGRHGGPAEPVPFAEGLRLAAPDGAVADVSLPFGGTPSDAAELVAAAGMSYRLGLLLARRGAFAVGVAQGARLLTSKVDRRYVQGRTAAGGSSQQRFARRRDNQARQSAQAAADVAARLLLPELDRLDAVVVGGDRRIIDAVLADRRLTPLGGKIGGWFLDVPEPRQAVLEDALVLARSARIRVVESGDRH